MGLSTLGDTYISGGHSILFSGVKTLQGGSGNDTFDFNNNSTFIVNSGAGVNSFVLADGVTANSLTGQGTDTLDYSAYTTSVSVNLNSGNATNVTSTTGIENVIGGSNNDILTGDSLANILSGRRWTRHSHGQRRQ